MKKVRGRVEEINGQYFWYDIKDNPHNLVDMDESYLNNCINLLQNRKAKLKDFDQHKDLHFLRVELDHKIAVRQTPLGKCLYA